MNSMELKIARMRKEIPQKQMAKVIKRSIDSYSKKERGEVAFFPDEILNATLELDLSLEEFNTIFFDGNLRFRKKEGVSSPVHASIIAQDGGV